MITEEEMELIRQEKLVLKSRDGTEAKEWAPWIIVSLNMDLTENSTHMYKKWLRILWQNLNDIKK